MRKQIVIAGIVTILMILCVIPVSSSEQSEALTGNSDGMSLNVDSAVIYTSGSPTSVELSLDSVPTGVDADEASWSFVKIGDGDDFVSFEDGICKGSSVVVCAGDIGSSSVKSVEVVAQIGTLHASAVIVVYPSPSTTATTFHYYIKIDQSAIPAGVTAQSTFTDGHTIQDFYNGFWIEVKQSQYTGTGSWNAMNAFQWYCDQHNWNCSASSSGWIDTILNLGTYQGSGSVWIYWSQFHAEGNSWVFNNTTMGYITSVSESYIGLLFRASTSATDTVTFPGYPEGTA